MAISDPRRRLGQMRPLHGDHLSLLCDDLFTSFTRADQRRWGEVYVRGLANVPGRKSIRRISQLVVGWRADQRLQQFVNQSPWSWEPVRMRLAHQLTAQLAPVAWVVSEAVFRKNGDLSVGVARQYAAAAGALLNCQLGLAVALVGPDGVCPVNWRLLLPRSWQDDEALRARCHLPDAERHRPRWQHVLDALDEMITEWALTPPPVVLDGLPEQEVEPLLLGLEARGLRYLLRVPATTTPVPVQPAAGCRRLPEVGGRWTRGGVEATRVRLGPGHGAAGRRVVLEGRRRAQAAWLTNMTDARLPDLITLMRSARMAEQELDRMGDGCGLRHFEGRSFRGWHHHVTLASVAHGHQLLQRLHAEQVGHRPFVAV
jgi:hypothetical protein